ncbi:BQ2448_2948 [Microbotryum intermedium]|uniref:BQ2448_2948 protein n=1 Tax=Microbotryum intermedium TaxID=269621 RepID=A0A238FBZ3_9BASI|nr:BQ2448_2948 [Microbotryum intermedium]
MQTIREKIADGLEPIRPSRRRSGIEIARICLCYAMMFMFGLNVSATGSKSVMLALKPDRRIAKAERCRVYSLPSIIAQYHVPVSVISTVFLTLKVGFFLACIASSYLMHNLGIRATLMCGNGFWVMGCLVFLLQPSFPLVVLALMCMGACMGLAEPTVVTVINREKSAVLTSCLYSCLAFGAVFSPLIIGSFADRQVGWTNFYYFPLGLCVVLSLANFFIFRTYEADLLEAEREELRRTTVIDFAIRYPGQEEVQGQDRRKSLFLSTSSSKKVQQEDQFKEVQTGLERQATHSSTSTVPGASALLLRVLRYKVTWLGFALIILTLSEAEMLGGWSTTYFLQVKQAPEGVSRYISSGKWAGKAIGLLLMPIFLLPLLGEKPFAILLLLLASSMLLIIALLPSWKASAIATAFFGFVSGPITPHVLSMVGSRVPKDMMGSAMALTLASGVMGGAAGPLLFGVLGADKGHLNALPYVCIGLLGISAVGWLFVPKKKEEGVVVDAEC